jgi:gluconate kinase
MLEVMPLIWVTGISGAGKSTVAVELRRRRFRAFDADEDGVSVWVNRSTGAVVPSPPRGQRPGWWATQHAWVLDIARVEELTAPAAGAPIFLCGSVENERDAWKLFDQVICLVIDDDTVQQRLTTRTTNDFGKSDQELEMILGWNATTESIYRDLDATIVDATVALEQVVDCVLAAAGAEAPKNGPRTAPDKALEKPTEGPPRVCPRCRRRARHQGEPLGPRGTT